MRPQLTNVSHATILSAALTLGLALAVSAQESAPASDLAQSVRFELGEAEFAPGDSITIQRVTGTSATIGTGETYCVEGTYALASKDAADLALYTTTKSSVATRSDPSQIMHVEKGNGTFRLVKVMREPGYLHVSFYPAHGGSAFGGVYFGQGAWVLHHKGWSYLNQHGQSPDYTTSGTTAGAPVSVTGPNRAILEYLGDPVEPPADLDPAYSKEGLVKAVQTAAQKAGITLKQLEIDDAEFPFLVGVVCKKGDYEKLKAQFRKMPVYEYGGSVGSDTCNALNLVPYRAFPQQDGLRISHRLGVRMQVFQAKLLRSE